MSTPGSSPTDLRRAAAESSSFRKWVTNESLILFVIGSLVFVTVSRLFQSVYDTALQPATEKLFGVYKLEERCAGDQSTSKLCGNRLLAVQWLRLGAAVAQAGLVFGGIYFAVKFSAKRGGGLAKSVETAGGIDHDTGHEYAGAN